MSRTTNVTIPQLILKTAVTGPVIATSLLLHAGEHVLKKIIPLLSDEKNRHPASGVSDESIFSGTDSKTSHDADTVFGMRPFGPKIYIRE